MLLLYRWWRDRRLKLVLIVYGSSTFVFNVLDELAPLYAAAPVTSVRPGCNGGGLISKSYAAPQTLPTSVPGLLC